MPIAASSRRGGSRRRHLRILVRRHARDADRAHDPAARNDRHAAFRDARPERQDSQPGAAAGDRIFERLGGTAELDRGAGLGLGEADRESCALSSRCSISKLPPESTIAIDTPHLLVAASASAAAMIFFAAAIEIGSP